MSEFALVTKIFLEFLHETVLFMGPALRLLH
jgi:hypothetical protein